jgi:hypothetical protein
VRQNFDHNCIIYTYPCLPNYLTLTCLAFDTSICIIYLWVQPNSLTHMHNLFSGIQDSFTLVCDLSRLSGLASYYFLPRKTQKLDIEKCFRDDVWGRTEWVGTNSEGRRGDSGSSRRVRGQESYTVELWLERWASWLPWWKVQNEALYGFQMLLKGAVWDLGDRGRVGDPHHWVDK